MRAEAPNLAAAKRLLDAAKRGGFCFQRVAPGPDGPLWSMRETLEAGHPLPRRIRSSVYRHPSPQIILDHPGWSAGDPASRRRRVERAAHRGVRVGSLNPGRAAGRA
jgi:hypothetical protein